MANRAPICPACEERWPQRNARFCGRCGGPLDEPDATATRRRWRRGTVLAVRAVGVVAIIGLLGAVATLDLSGTEPETSVDVDDDLSPQGTPLSPSEAQALREQADPDRLRCEPRGCELWRLERPHEPHGGGFVALDDGLILVLGGTTSEVDVPLFGDGAEADDGGDGERSEPLRGRELIAIDPTTGEEQWRRTIRTAGRPASDWTQLLEGPHGPLVVTGAEVIALDQRGEESWRWEPGDAQGFHVVRGRTMSHTDIVVVNSFASRSPGDGDAAISDADLLQERFDVLDPATGETLWWVEAATMTVEPDLIAVADDAGIRSLAPRTGEVLWERPSDHPVTVLAGDLPWLVAHEDRTYLLDRATGDELGGVDGWLLHGLLTPVADRWVGIVQDHDPHGALADGAIELRMVVFDDDGSTAWTAPAGTVDMQREFCCNLAEIPDTTSFTVAGTSGSVRTFDIETGDLLDVEELAGNGGGQDATASRVFSPLDGLELEWWFERHRAVVRTDDGETTVFGVRGLHLEAIDPLVFGDEDSLIGVQVVPDR